MTDAQARLEDDDRRLQWHIGDNLRWLADNPGADYLPCGMLHGSFLVQVAEGYEHLVSERQRLSRTPDAQPSSTDEVERLREAVIAAYIAGAKDVHENWQEGRDPDFTEAAHDYATDALAHQTAEERGNGH